jgi:hypothetical protein
MDRWNTWTAGAGYFRRRGTSFPFFACELAYHHIYLFASLFRCCCCCCCNYCNLIAVVWFFFFFSC